MDNRGFEEAGASPGQALNWTLGTVAFVEELSAFDTAAEAYEDFSEGWRLPMLTPGILELGRMELGAGGVFTDGAAYVAPVYSSLLQARVETLVPAAPDNTTLAVFYLDEGGAPGNEPTEIPSNELPVGAVIDVHPAAGDLGVQDVSLLSHAPARGGGVVTVRGFRRYSWSEHVGTEASSNASNEASKFTFVDADLAAGEFVGDPVEGFEHHWRNAAGFLSDLDALTPEELDFVPGGAGTVEGFDAGWAMPASLLVVTAASAPGGVLPTLPAVSLRGLWFVPNEAPAWLAPPAGATTYRARYSYLDGGGAPRTAELAANVRVTPGNALSAVLPWAAGCSLGLRPEVGTVIASVTAAPAALAWGHYQPASAPAEIIRTPPPLRAAELATWVDDLVLGAAVAATGVYEVWSADTVVTAGVFWDEAADVTWETGAFGGADAERFEVDWPAGAPWLVWQPQLLPGAAFARFGAQPDVLYGAFAEVAPGVMAWAPTGASGVRNALVPRVTAMAGPVELTATWRAAPGGPPVSGPFEIDREVAVSTEETMAGPVNVVDAVVQATPPPPVIGNVDFYGADVVEEFNDPDWILEF